MSSAVTPIKSVTHRVQRGEGTVRTYFMPCWKMEFLLVLAMISVNQRMTTMLTK